MQTVAAWEMWWIWNWMSALVVAAPGKFFCIFCPACEYIIPWKRVVRIGPDIILVDVCVEDVKS